MTLSIENFIERARKCHGDKYDYSSVAYSSTNKKVFGELYAATLQRESAIRLAGYNLVTIWESNWKKLKNNAS
jgi:hypothetical protein